MEERNIVRNALEKRNNGIMGKDFFSVLNPIFQNSIIPIFHAR